MIVYVIETFNTKKSVPCAICIKRINKLSG